MTTILSPTIATTTNVESSMSTDNKSSSPSSSDEGGSSLTEPLLTAETNDEGEHLSSFVMESSDQNASISQHCYVADPHRYFVLTVFSLNNLIASAFWITFAPIDDAVEVYYRGISANQVNWLSMVMMAMYGPGTLMCSWGISDYGLRATVVFSSILISLGALLRWGSVFFIDENNHSTLAYNILLSGQAVASLGKCVFCNAPATVASSWFQKTTNAIGVMVLSGAVGMTVAQTMSPLLVQETTGAHLDLLLAGQALVAILCTIATWWWFEAQPTLPPSTAEAARRAQQQNTSQTTVCSKNALKQNVWKLAKDTQYIILLAAFGIGYGADNACLTLSQSWVASAGYEGDATAGLCGALCIIGGVLGNLIAAPLLSATQNYNQAIRWSYAVAFLVAVATVGVMQIQAPVWLLATAFFALGMSQFPLMTIAMDAAAAHTYPIPESLSSAGLLLMGQYLGIAFTDIIGNFITNNNDRKGFASPANITLVGLFGMSSIIALCYHGDDPRAVANLSHGNSGVATDEESED